MRPEKEYLVEEIARHLDKGDYVILTNYERMTVPDIANLRQRLAPQKAEFHVIKNNILTVALTRRSLPGLQEHLFGPTAIVTGGKNAPEVAKLLLKFTKDTEKGAIKGGLIGKSAFGPDQAKAVSELPTREQLLGKLLGTFKAPGQQMVNVLAAPATQFLNVMNAYKKKLEDAAAA